MQPEELQTRIAYLEREYVQYGLLLDKSFEKNEEFGKTKIIFHKLKEIKEELDNLKKKKRDLNSKP